LLENDAWNMQQVGITGQPDRRMATHFRWGWEVVDIRGPMDGLLAQSWERSILDYLSDQGIPTTPSTARAEPSREGAATGPKTGEAWWISDLHVTSVIGLMNLIHESEETAEPMS
jgi:hypothetical protein